MKYKTIVCAIIFALLQFNVSVVAASKNDLVLDNPLIMKEEKFYSGPPKDGIP